MCWCVVLIKEETTFLFLMSVNMALNVFGLALSSFMHPASHVFFSALAAVLSQDCTDLKCSFPLFNNRTMFIKHKLYNNSVTPHSNYCSCY